MNLSPSVTDNVTEILLKILKFTKARKEILSENISSMAVPDFVPKDLDVENFSDLMNNAVNQHIQSKRLVLYDTESIRFGRQGTLEIDPVNDFRALRILRNDPDEYLEIQINKLLENSLNYKVAAQLLNQKEGMTLFFE